MPIYKFWTQACNHGTGRMMILKTEAIMFRERGCQWAHQSRITVNIPHIYNVIDILDPRLEVINTTHFTLKQTPPYSYCL